MSDLVPGTVLGGRFEVLGVVGRGGSAVVYLARDVLRSERVALKVVHTHLSSDPAVRRRLQREVKAASVLQDSAVLAPHDLHELDGRLALTMRFHPGESLSELVAANGALSSAQVRALGVRIAGALAAAHRAGVLHRDVTPNNILLRDDATDAVITDFGLARLQDGGTRSTTALGTAGYAAPEVYGGHRADPRSDLYGLGAALYLAATGAAPFDVRDPMAALHQQLGDAFTPVLDHRPDLDPALAQLIEDLLRRDPAARPQGAREVVDRLQGAPAPTPPARPAADVQRQYLPPGGWTVVVKERDQQKGRRARARVERGLGPRTSEADLHRFGMAIAGVVRSALGIHSPDALSPEDLLARLVAREAGLAEDALEVSEVTLSKRFRLVDRTSEDAALRLAEGARMVGFKARVVDVARPSKALDWLATYFWVPIVLGWTVTPLLASSVGFELPEIVWPLLIVMSVLLPIYASTRGPPASVKGLATAYKGDLERALKPDRAHAPPRYAVAEAPAFVPAAAEEGPPPLSRGAALLARSEAALAQLRDAMTARAETLPEIVAVDLRSTCADLERSARALAVEVDQLESALGPGGAANEALGMVQRRLDRLQTLQRAGEAIDPAQLEQLRAALAEHEADRAAEAAVEARLAAATAQLLEIASTASRVRRELLVQQGAPSPRDAVERLRAEARAVDLARREAAVRLRQSQ